MKLRTKNAKYVSNTRYRGAEATTQVLVLSTILTPPMAGKLGIREGCFNSDGVPHQYKTFPSPMLRIDGADLTLDGKDFRAKTVGHFSVKQPKTGNENDTHLELSFRMHFADDVPIDMWARRVNDDQFEMLIDARQEDLKFGGEEAEVDDEEEPACIHCANGVPMSIGKGVHENGNKCTAPKPAAEPSLASAREVGGGTHRRDRKSAAAEPVQ